MDWEALLAISPRNAVISFSGHELNTSRCFNEPVFRPRTMNIASSTWMGSWVSSKTKSGSRFALAKAVS